MEGGMLKDHVCAQIIEQLRKNYPNLWESLELESQSTGAFTLEHLNTKLTFRPSASAGTYTCSLLQTEFVAKKPAPLSEATSSRQQGGGSAITRQIISSSKSLSLREGLAASGASTTGPPRPKQSRLPIALEQLICSLSKAYEHHGTPSEYLSCLPLLNQCFWPDDYSLQSHHLLFIPEAVLLFLIDDDDMKVNDQFQFEHLMTLPEGRRFYHRLNQVLTLYKESGGVIVEFNGHQLHTHSGTYLSASDIVACLKSCYLMTKMMAMPFDCVWAPTDYPLFTKCPSEKGVSCADDDDDCVQIKADSSAVRGLYERYMKGNLRWCPKTQIHGVSKEIVEQLENAHMEETNGGAELAQLIKVDGSEGEGSLRRDFEGEDESCAETRSDTSAEEDDSSSDDSISGRAMPPSQIIALSELIDSQSQQTARSINELMSHIPHITRGCSDHGLWYPHHLTFRTPFPFQDQGYVLWRAFVYFGKCVAACPVNISDPIGGDLETNEAQANELRKAICGKVEQLRSVWDRQASMSQDELPMVWRYSVDLWIHGNDIWTERLRPISKFSCLLFTWEELRQWGLFKQMCGLPVIRVPETATSNDDFARLFAGQRPIPQQI